MLTVRASLKKEVRFFAYVQVAERLFFPFSKKDRARGILESQGGTTSPSNRWVEYPSAGLVRITSQELIEGCGGTLLLRHGRPSAATGAKDVIVS